MELLLTKEKHKELVEELFKASRKADKLVEGLETLGVGEINGATSRVLYSPCRFMEIIATEEILEDDNFFDDFFGAKDFEEFYHKWFEE